MNEHNYAYLKDQLRYADFGDKLDGELREKLQKPHDFSLVYGKEYGNDEVAAILRFKKSTESDLVFLTNYTVYLSSKVLEPRQQTFQLKGMSGVTLDKSYNLLSGRAVLQEFPERKGWEFSWVKLDLSQKDNHQNYTVRQFKDDFGQTFSKAVTKLSIFPMDSFSSEKIIDSLERGDLQPALCRVGDKDVRLYMTYDPAAKDMVLYDKGMKRLSAHEMAPFMKPEKHVINERQASHEESLLPKKRERGHRKGLSV